MLQSQHFPIAINFTAYRSAHSDELFDLMASVWTHIQLAHVTPPPTSCQGHPEIMCYLYKDEWSVLQEPRNSTIAQVPH